MDIKAKVIDHWSAGKVVKIEMEEVQAYLIPKEAYEFGKELIRLALLAGHHPPKPEPLLPLPTPPKENP